MDQGINLPFSSHGIDDATFGLPTFADGWKGLIITGSSQKPLRSGDGGRLLLHIKCQYDPDNKDTGKEHLISLNLWHPDENVKANAAKEMASICRAIGVLQFNNTAELYNKPFMAKAVTQTPAPTPEYPSPNPQTNWRGYANANGQGINTDGPNGRMDGQPGGGGGFGGAGGPPNFNQQGQQPNNSQQAGNPQGGQGGWNPNAGQQPQQQPQQGQQPQQNWGGNGTNGQQPQQDPNAGGWGGAGSGAPNGNGAQTPQDASNGGGWAPPNGQNAQTQFPSNGQPQGGGWGGPQQGGTAPWGGNG